jgi:hypothetical protein
MKRILVVALSALMLSGCIAEWKSNRTGPRWKDQPASQPFSANLGDSGPVSNGPPPVLNNPGAN